MPARTPKADEQIDGDAAALSISEITAYLQDALGQKITAHLVGSADTAQIARYREPDGSPPNATIDLRLREGYEVTRRIVETFDDTTARAWLFGTNACLDDEAPVAVLRRASEPTQFAEVKAAARSLVGFGG